MPSVGRTAGLSAWVCSSCAAQAVGSTAPPIGAAGSGAKASIELDEFSATSALQLSEQEAGVRGDVGKKGHQSPTKEANAAAPRSHAGSGLRAGETHAKSDEAKPSSAGATTKQTAARDHAASTGADPASPESAKPTEEASAPADHHVAVAKHSHTRDKNPDFYVPRSSSTVETELAEETKRIVDGTDFRDWISSYENEDPGAKYSRFLHSASVFHPKLATSYLDLSWDLEGGAAAAAQGEPRAAVAPETGGRDAVRESDRYLNTVMQTEVAQARRRRKRKNKVAHGAEPVAQPAGSSFVETGARGADTGPDHEEDHNHDSNHERSHDHEELEDDHGHSAHDAQEHHDHHDHDPLSLSCSAPFSCDGHTAVANLASEDRLPELLLHRDHIGCEFPREMSMLELLSKKEAEFYNSRLDLLLANPMGGGSSIASGSAADDHAEGEGFAKIHPKLSSSSGAAGAASFLEAGISGGMTAAAADDEFVDAETFSQQNLLPVPRPPGLPSIPESNRDPQQARAASLSTSFLERLVEKKPVYKASQLTYFAFCKGAKEGESRFGKSLNAPEELYLDTVKFLYKHGRNREQIAVVSPVAADSVLRKRWEDAKQGHTTAGEPETRILQQSLEHMGWQMPSDLNAYGREYCHDVAKCTADAVDDCEHRIWLEIVDAFVGAMFVEPSHVSRKVCNKLSEGEVMQRLIEESGSLKPGESLGDTDSKACKRVCGIAVEDDDGGGGEGGGGEGDKKGEKNGDDEDASSDDENKEEKEKETGKPKKEEEEGANYFDKGMKELDKGDDKVDEKGNVETSKGDDKGDGTKSKEDEKETEANPGNKEDEKETEANPGNKEDEKESEEKAKQGNGGGEDSGDGPKDGKAEQEPDTNSGEKKGEDDEGGDSSSSFAQVRYRREGASSFLQIRENEMEGKLVFGETEKTRKSGGGEVAGDGADGKAEGKANAGRTASQGGAPADGAGNDNDETGVGKGIPVGKAGENPSKDKAQQFPPDRKTPKGGDAPDSVAKPSDGDEKKDNPMADADKSVSGDPFGPPFENEEGAPAGHSPDERVPLVPRTSALLDGFHFEDDSAGIEFKDWRKVAVAQDGELEACRRLGAYLDLEINPGSHADWSLQEAAGIVGGGGVGASGMGVDFKFFKDADRKVDLAKSQAKNEYPAYTNGKSDNGVDIVDDFKVVEETFYQRFRLYNHWQLMGECEKANTLTPGFLPQLDVMEIDRLLRPEAAVVIGGSEVDWKGMEDAQKRSGSSYDGFWGESRRSLPTECTAWNFYARIATLREMKVHFLNTVSVYGTDLVKAIILKSLDVVKAHNEKAEKYVEKVEDYARKNDKDRMFFYYLEHPMELWSGHVWQHFTTTNAQIEHHLMKQTQNLCDLFMVPRRSYCVDFYNLPDQACNPGTCSRRYIVMLATAATAYKEIWDATFYQGLHHDAFIGKMQQPVSANLISRLYGLGPNRFTRPAGAESLSKLGGLREQGQTVTFRGVDPYHESIAFRHKHISDEGESIAQSLEAQFVIAFQKMRERSMGMTTDFYSAEQSCVQRDLETQIASNDQKAAHVKNRVTEIKEKAIPDLQKAYLRAKQDALKAVQEALDVAQKANKKASEQLKKVDIEFDEAAGKSPAASDSDASSSKDADGAGDAPVAAEAESFSEVDHAPGGIAAAGAMVQLKASASPSPDLSAPGKGPGMEHDRGNFMIRQKLQRMVARSKTEVEELNIELKLRQGEIASLQTEMKEHSARLQREADALNEQEKKHGERLRKIDVAQNAPECFPPTSRRQRGAGMLYEGADFAVGMRVIYDPQMDPGASASDKAREQQMSDPAKRYLLRGVLKERVQERFWKVQIASEVAMREVPESSLTREMHKGVQVSLEVHPICARHLFTLTNEDAPGEWTISAFIPGGEDGRPAGGGGGSALLEGPESFAETMAGKAETGGKHHQQKKSGPGGAADAVALSSGKEIVTRRSTTRKLLRRHVDGENSSHSKIGNTVASYGKYFADAVSQSAATVASSVLSVFDHFASSQSAASRPAKRSAASALEMKFREEGSPSGSFSTDTYVNSAQDETAKLTTEAQPGCNVLPHIHEEDMRWVTDKFMEADARARSQAFAAQKKAEALKKEALAVLERAKKDLKDVLGDIRDADLSNDMGPKPFVATRTPMFFEDIAKVVPMCEKRWTEILKDCGVEVDFESGDKKGGTVKPIKNVDGTHTVSIRIDKDGDGKFDDTKEIKLKTDQSRVDKFVQIARDLHQGIALHNLALKAAKGATGAEDEDKEGLALGYVGHWGSPEKKKKEDEKFDIEFIVAKLKKMWGGWGGNFIVTCLIVGVLYLAYQGSRHGGFHPRAIAGAILQGTELQEQTIRPGSRTVVGGTVDLAATEELAQVGLTVGAPVVHYELGFRFSVLTDDERFGQCGILHGAAEGSGAGLVVSYYEDEHVPAVLSGGVNLTVPQDEVFPLEPFRLWDKVIYWTGEKLAFEKAHAGDGGFDLNLKNYGVGKVTALAPESPSPDFGWSLKLHDGELYSQPETRNANEIRFGEGGAKVGESCSVKDDLNPDDRDAETGAEIVDRITPLFVIEPLLENELWTELDRNQPPRVDSAVGMVRSAHELRPLSKWGIGRFKVGDQVETPEDGSGVVVDFVPPFGPWKVSIEADEEEDSDAEDGHKIVEFEAHELRAPMQAAEEMREIQVQKDDSVAAINAEIDRFQAVKAHLGDLKEQSEQDGGSLDKTMIDGEIDRVENQLATLRQWAAAKAPKAGGAPATTNPPKTGGAPAISNAPKTGGAPAKANPPKTGGPPAKANAPKAGGAPATAGARNRGPTFGGSSPGGSPGGASPGRGSSGGVSNRSKVQFGGASSVDIAGSSPGKTELSPEMEEEMGLGPPPPPDEF